MQHMVSCKQVTWINKQIKMVQDTTCCICKGNYKFYCSWRWSCKPETCRAKI